MSPAFYILPLLIAVLFVLERRFPLRTAKTSLADRLPVNVGLGASALITALLVVKPLASAAWDLETRYPLGVLHLMSMPLAVEAVLTFLLFDLSFYYWHRANHRVPFLWRLHVVHHIDPDLDVTTTFRFHCGEVALSAGFRALQIVLIGGSIPAAIAYELAFQVNTALQHSNLRLPIRMEQWLNLVIVTPRMHGIHHSKNQHENNSNWSSVFSFWDRLHRSLRLDIPQSRLDIGIPGYAGPTDNRFRNTLLMPFGKQRDYWQGPIDETAIRAPLPAKGRQTPQE